MKSGMHAVVRSWSRQWKILQFKAIPLSHDFLKYPLNSVRHWQIDFSNLLGYLIYQHLRRKKMGQNQRIAWLFSSSNPALIKTSPRGKGVLPHQLLVPTRWMPPTSVRQFLRWYRQWQIFQKFGQKKKVWWGGGGQLGCHHSRSLGT